MKTKSKIPALRFKGFTDAWEQRKLIDYLEVSKEKNKNEVFGKEDVLSVSGDYGIVNQIEFQGRSFAGASVAPYGIVDTGDIVYTKSPLKSNPYGIIKANKGKTGIVSTLYAVYKPLDNVCSDFVQIYFEQDARMNNYMHPLVNKGAKNDMKVSDVNALKGEVCFPSKYEQIKISEHFAKLDRLIALHQRKCDQTKELKKTMLQKMFPKKGERIPEIRFPEFTDEWEEKKLGEVVEREIKGKAKANMQGTKSIYLETEYLNGGETTFVDSDADIEEDDILILWDGSQAGTVYHGFFGALGSTLKAYRPKESGKFVYYQLVAHQEMIFQRYRTPNIPHVIKTFTDEFSVFTTSLSEQERIGNFFKHLDTLIALHQSKCDSLKELKKTLLRQLFV